MWFIGVEVEQETSAHPPKKNPGSAPGAKVDFNSINLVRHDSSTTFETGLTLHSFTFWRHICKQQICANP